MPNAFITARSGTCYLTVNCFGCNHELLKIRAYTIDAVTKRDLRRWHPDVSFDWEKITQQLAEKRVHCRSWRSRRQLSTRKIGPKSAMSFYDPLTRTLYADEPSSWQEAAALLDAVLQADKG